MDKEPPVLDARGSAARLSKLLPGETILVKKFPVDPEARASKFLLGGRQYAVVRTEEGFRGYRTK